MEYLPTLLSLLVVDFLAAASPGPNFIAVTQAAMQGTRRYALATVVGLAVANLIWCSAVAFGLAALFKMSPWLYNAIKIAGGLYLIYLGVCLWRSSGTAPNADGSRIKESLIAAGVRGLLINLSNPKSLVYFSSVFAVFMSPAVPSWVQMSAVGIVIFNTLLWYGTVAALFSRLGIQRRYIAKQRLVSRVGGTVMAAFGVRLILVRE